MLARLLERRINVLHGENTAHDTGGLLINLSMAVAVGVTRLLEFRVIHHCRDLGCVVK